MKRATFESYFADNFPNALTFDEVFEVRIAGSHPVYVYSIAKLLSVRAGGVSITAGTGGWISPNGEFEVEDSTLLSVNCSDAEAVLEYVLPHLVKYTVDTNQYSLWLRLNDKAFVVDRITLVQAADEVARRRQVEESKYAKVPR